MRKTTKKDESGKIKRSRRKYVPVFVEDYGPVKVMQGPYKDRIGYYDDDDDWPIKAVVYFEAPLKSNYVLIPHRFLTEATFTPLQLQKLELKDPAFVKAFDIRTRREE